MKHLHGWIGFGALACMAALAYFIGFAAAAGADDKPTPNARFGNVLYQKPAPAVWKQSQRNGRLVFSADLPAPDFTEIEVFPDGPLKGDFRQMFDATVSTLLKQRGVVKIERDSGVQESQAREGFPVLQRTVYAEARDFHTAHWFLAGNSGGRFDMIAFETSGEEGWNAHIAEATQFFSSVKLANSLPPEQIPATLRSTTTQGAKNEVTAALATPSTAAPPQSTALQVGSKVEGYQATSSKWQTGIITEIETNGQHKGPYHVVFDDKKLTFPDEWLGKRDVRPAGMYTNKYSRGARVDIISRLDRGTVIQVNGFDYKVHRDGCQSYWDAWYDGSDLHPAPTLSVSSPDVKFLVGNWKMFQPGAPNTVVKGNDVYREYGLGAKAPPLQILANGHYVWKEDFDQPAVRGTWKTSAKIAPHGREKSMVYNVNGIVIKDRSGRQWRVYREVYKGKKADSITVRCLCEGLELMGTRG